MRTPPLTASLDDTVSTIVERMVANDIGAAIILDSRGLPIGIVTERNMVEKILKERRDPSKTRAQEIMSSPLVSVEVGTAATDALMLMRKNNIRRLPVTRKGRLAGIMTERRILDYVYRLITTWLHR